MCFDKHDGRIGTTIDNPPQRKPGGVVVPCPLITSHDVCEGGHKTVNIINNNIALSALSNSPTFTGKQSKEFKDPARGTKKRTRTDHIS